MAYYTKSIVEISGEQSSCAFSANGQQLTINHLSYTGKFYSDVDRYALSL